MSTREFAPGDTVWHARFRAEKQIIPCPVCFGNLVVHVVLGDDSVVETQCDYCRRGYEASRGYVQEYTEWHDATRQATVVGVSLKLDGDARVVEYYKLDSDIHTYVDDVFDDEASARARAAVMRDEYQRGEESRQRGHKKSVVDGLTWSIGYHQREAKEHRRKLEYHERMAIVRKDEVKRQKARRNPAGGDVPTAAAESDVIPASHGHAGSVAADLHEQRRMT